MEVMCAQCMAQVEIDDEVIELIGSSFCPLCHSYINFVGKGGGHIYSKYDLQIDLASWGNENG